jgi:hypothetical protein
VALCLFAGIITPNWVNSASNFGQFRPAEWDKSLLFNLSIYQLLIYQVPTPYPPGFTQFHPRSPNFTQASAEGRKSSNSQLTLPLSFQRASSGVPGQPLAPAKRFGVMELYRLLFAFSTTMFTAACAAILLPQLLIPALLCTYILVGVPFAFVL